ncbi:uncharacterized protein LOC144368963 [Ictidomys tridecemlineatus]
MTKPLVTKAAASVARAQPAESRDRKYDKHPSYSATWGRPAGRAGSQQGTGGEDLSRGTTSTLPAGFPRGSRGRRPPALAARAAHCTATPFRGSSLSSLHRALHRPLGSAPAAAPELETFAAEQNLAIPRNTARLVNKESRGGGRGSKGGRESPPQIHAGPGISSPQPDPCPPQERTGYQIRPQLFICSNESLAAVQSEALQDWGVEGKLLAAKHRYHDQGYRQIHEHLDSMKGGLHILRSHIAPLKRGAGTGLDSR